MYIRYFSLLSLSLSLSLFSPIAEPGVKLVRYCSPTKEVDILFINISTTKHVQNRPQVSSLSVIVNLFDTVSGLPSAAAVSPDRLIASQSRLHAYLFPLAFL